MGDERLSLRDDHVLTTTRWVSGVVVPVLLAAFVVLYFFPHRTMQLWSWMLCPEMSALVMGSGYLAGAYLFTRAATTGEWHRVSVGFVATTVFSTLLLATTILHWSQFNHDHVSFGAWLLLYVATPFLLPVLWRKNQRTDPQVLSSDDAAVPHRLRVAVGIGGALQMTFALVLFLWPGAVREVWPWGIDAVTGRALSAFVAFPAVTWFMFLFEKRWSSFRVTQHVATIGLAFITLGAVRARSGFLSDTGHVLYLVALVVALILNIALYVTMERRARAASQSGRHRARKSTSLITKERNHAGSPAPSASPPSVDHVAGGGGRRRPDRAGQRAGAGVGQA